MLKFYRVISSEKGTGLRSGFELQQIDLETPQ